MVLKRLMAPNYWPIRVKQNTYVIDPKAGPHSKYKSIPLGVVLRDVLKITRNSFESNKILQNSLVKVDNIIRKKLDFPIGLMDVLTVGDDNYRVTPSKKGLQLSKIDGNESKIKLFKIIDKSYIKNKLQLNLHDGKNLLVKDDNFKTGDVIVFDLDKKEIKSVLKFGKGSSVIITDGKISGNKGKIENYIVTKSSQQNEVIVNINGESLSIPKNYIFVIGEDKPIISLGE